MDTGCRRLEEAPQRIRAALVVSRVWLPYGSLASLLRKYTASYVWPNEFQLHRAVFGHSDRLPGPGLILILFVGHIKKEPSPTVPLLSNAKLSAPAQSLKILVAIFPNQSDGCDSTIETENQASKLEATQPKRARKPSKKAKVREEGVPRQEIRQQTDSGSRQQEGRSHRHDEAPRGATLAEIMATMGRQAHTVRGFVSILGSKGGEKIESSKSDAGERTYKIAR